MDSSGARLCSTPSLPLRPCIRRSLARVQSVAVMMKDAWWRPAGIPLQGMQMRAGLFQSRAGSRAPIPNRSTSADDIRLVRLGVGAGSSTFQGQWVNCVCRIGCDCNPRTCAVKKEELVLTLADAIVNGACRTVPTLSAASCCLYRFASPSAERAAALARASSACSLRS